MKTKVIIHKQGAVVHTDDMSNCYGSPYAVILSDNNLTRQTVLDIAGLTDVTIETFLSFWIFRSVIGCL